MQWIFHGSHKIPVSNKVPGVTHYIQGDAWRSGRWDSRLQKRDMTLELRALKTIVVRYTQHKFAIMTIFKCLSLVVLSTFPVLCSCDHHLPPELLILQNGNSVPIKLKPPTPHAHPSPGNHHSSSLSGRMIELDLSFCDWLISLDTVFSRAIHIAAYVRISFLFKAR